MKPWLENEVKWSRQQAVQTRTDVDNLRDPEWLARETRKLIYEAKSLHNKAAALEIEAEQYADAEYIQQQIERKERDIGYWENLAREASERLAQNEQADLFKDPA